MAIFGRLTCKSLAGHSPFPRWYLASNTHGAGFAAPESIVHGFINSGGMKMAKSLGNGVGPADIIPDYGAEAFRYFLRHQRKMTFTWEKFEAAYNGELNDLGNLVQRVAKMVQSYQAGVSGDTIRALKRREKHGVKTH